MFSAEMHAIVLRIEVVMSVMPVNLLVDVRYTVSALEGRATRRRVKKGSVRVRNV